MDIFPKQNTTLCSDGRHPEAASRQFTNECKTGVVRLVLDERKTVGAMAREMDLTETAVRDWVSARRLHDRRIGLTTADGEEKIANCGRSATSGKSDIHNTGLRSSRRLVKKCTGPIAVPSAESRKPAARR